MDTNTILERGTDTIFPTKEALQKALDSKKPLRIYLGVDPTGDTLHIGHTVPLRKLKQFQEAGHHTTLLIGNFTAQIGDPTGKDKTREPLTPEQVQQNFETYKEQAQHILNFEGKNATEIRFNADWLAPMTFSDVIKLASNFTVQQMLERDMFERRIKAEKPVGLHEFLYPLMQGYDSVALEADVEIGGTDQTFNMLAGRTLRKSLQGKEKFVVTVPLLTDSSGKKIGKTEGNAIGITDKPNDLFGKIMSIGDDAILNTLRLCTDMPEKDIATTKTKLEKGANPRDAKILLAKEIVGMYHSPKEADAAEAEFHKIFANKELPTNIPEHTRKSLKGITLADIIAELDLAPSKTEAKRLVDQGAVKINQKKISDWKQHLPDGEIVLQVGKRKFVKIQ